MATGFDELLEFLLSEIALCGVQGMFFSSWRIPSKEPFWTPSMNTIFAQFSVFLYVYVHVPDFSSQELAAQTFVVSFKRFTTKSMFLEDLVGHSMRRSGIGSTITEMFASSTIVNLVRFHFQSSKPWNYKRRVPTGLHMQMSSYRILLRTNLRHLPTRLPFDYLYVNAC